MINSSKRIIVLKDNENIIDVSNSIVTNIYDFNRMQLPNEEIQKSWNNNEHITNLNENNNIIKIQ